MIDGSLKLFVNAELSPYRWRRDPKWKRYSSADGCFETMAWKYAQRENFKETLKLTYLQSETDS